MYHCTKRFWQNTETSRKVTFIIFVFSNEKYKSKRTFSVNNWVVKCIFTKSKTNKTQVTFSDTESTFQRFMFQNINPSLIILSLHEKKIRFFACIGFGLHFVKYDWIWVFSDPYIAILGQSWRFCPHTDICGSIEKPYCGIFYALLFCYEYSLFVYISMLNISSKVPTKASRQLLKPGPGSWTQTLKNVDP